uniref:Uncharacterized protein n=1 Tax=Sarcoptes scabiei TaxID=52283 RepID=A0A834R7H8_SARSC
MTLEESNQSSVSSTENEADSLINNDPEQLFIEAEAEESVHFDHPRQDSAGENFLKYLEQIRSDSNGKIEIPRELLEEDQDLLDSEFVKLDNDMDVIDNYLNQLNEHANILQDKLQNLLDKMDRTKMIELIKNDIHLKNFLEDPSIRIFLDQILENELFFTENRFDTHSKAVRTNHHYEGSRTDHLISPLETQLINPNYSKEQNFLRYLLELIKNTD